MLFKTAARSLLYDVRHWKIYSLFCNSSIWHTHPLITTTNPYNLYILWWCQIELAQSKGSFTILSSKFVVFNKKKDRLFKPTFKQIWCWFNIIRRCYRLSKGLNFYCIFISLILISFFLSFYNGNPFLHFYKHNLSSWSISLAVYYSHTQTVFWLFHFVGYLSYWLMLYLNILIYKRSMWVNYLLKVHNSHFV